MSNKDKFKLPSNLANNQESEDEIADNKNINDYKGVFYKEDTEQLYYEGGSHFSFKDICKRLEKLFWMLSLERRGPSLYSDQKPLENEKNGKIKNKIQKNNQEIKKNSSFHTTLKISTKPLIKAKITTINPYF